MYLAGYVLEFQVSQFNNFMLKRFLLIWYIEEIEVFLIFNAMNLWL